MKTCKRPLTKEGLKDRVFRRTFARMKPVVAFTSDLKKQNKETKGD